MTQCLVITDQAAASAVPNGVLTICPDRASALTLANRLAKEDPSIPVRVYEQTDVIVVPTES